MSATHEGGIKTRDKNLARNPNYYKEMGARGGRKGHTGGFADRNLAARAGSKGGSISRNFAKPEFRQRAYQARIRKIEIQKFGRLRAWIRRHTRANTKVRPHRADTALALDQTRNGEVI